METISIILVLVDVVREPIEWLFQTHLVLTINFCLGVLNMRCGHQALKKLGGALLWLILESLSLGCNSLFRLGGVM
jgi:hypothetical protein